MGRAGNENLAGMALSVETDAHLSELRSIYEELIRILAKYASNTYEA